MFVKFETDCNFAGCSTTHIVEVDDDVDDEHLDSLLDDFISQDVDPQGSYTILDEEDMHDIDEDEIENLRTPYEDEED